LNAIFGKWTGVILSLLLIWTLWFISDFFSQSEIDQTESITFAGVLTFLAVVMGLFKEK
jgi:hypothetical protein